MYDYALTELALSEIEFEDLVWLEFYYKKLANETRLARNMEPTRLLITVLVNSFGDGKKYEPHEIVPLVTDYNTFELNADTEDDDEFFKRMMLNNFYNTPTTKDKNNMED